LNMSRSAMAGFRGRHSRRSSQVSSCVDLGGTNRCSNAPRAGMRCRFDPAPWFILGFLRPYYGAENIPKSHDICDSKAVRGFAIIPERLVITGCHACSPRRRIGLIFPERGDVERPALTTPDAPASTLEVPRIRTHPAGGPSMPLSAPQEMSPLSLEGCRRKVRGRVVVG
jgi:hypothetical protein